MKVLKRTPEYLENRIRELEAELATEHDHCDRFTKERNEWKARAEKAESLNRADERRIAELLDTQNLLNAQAVSREARVARLIARLEQWKDPYTGEEAREREAE